MPSRVYIGGTVVEPHEAQISVFDRGFLFGDSVFETLRVYQGVPFAWDAHADRLRASASRIGFTLPFSADHLKQAAHQVIQASELSDASLRVIVTRGQGGAGIDPEGATDPQLIILCRPLPPMDASMYSRGQHAAIVDVRRSTGVDPAAKTGNYLASALAAREAKQHGADIAIMLDDNGRVAEGAASNIFVLTEKGWCTPPLDGILPGLTRQTILRLASENDIPIEEQTVWPADLRGAQEAFICSSLREIVPVVRVDQEPIGDGNVGPQTKQLHALYRACVDAEVAS